MPLVAEPSLLCDECGERIEPGSGIANLYTGILQRVEVPSYSKPYADIKEDQEEWFFHIGCVTDLLSEEEDDERPSLLKQLTTELSQRWSMRP